MEIISGVATKFGPITLAVQSVTGVQRFFGNFRNIVGVPGGVTSLGTLNLASFHFRPQAEAVVSVGYAHTVALRQRVRLP